VTSDRDGSFGDLSPLLAPRSVAVVGASDREGNLGGVAVGFLKKFGYAGAVWPVNPGRKTVADLPCFPSRHHSRVVSDRSRLVNQEGLRCRRPFYLSYG